MHSAICDIAGDIQGAASGRGLGLVNLVFAIPHPAEADKNQAALAFKRGK